jgi:hypothetical protein
MSQESDLVRRVRDEQDLVEILAGSFEFDIRRSECVGDPQLASGLPLEVIAGDFTGGKFYLCGEQAARPVWYASSEGEAGVIAKDFSDALGLVIGLPYWRDCLQYSNNGDLGSMQVAASFLQRDFTAGYPELASAQLRVADALELTLDPVSTLVSRLHATVQEFSPVDVFFDETGEYGGLFGPFPPSRNPLWR